MSRLADLLAQRRAAEQRELCQRFIRESLAPTKSVTVALAWLKVQAEGLTADFEEGGHRLTHPRWVDQGQLLEQLRTDGYRVRVDRAGKFHVYAKRRGPQ